ncbi:MAG: glycosyltransferase [Clostridia bacterium]|nr:glycosyltransferase [Clostridia bacterium]
MENKNTVCLFNDSFPPLIDGVASAVLNYAKHMEPNGFQPMVVTPSHANANDSVFPYPVIRYRSIKLPHMQGYKAGIPFSPTVAHYTGAKNIALLHSHCPIMSTFLAREVRQIVNAPIVLTYHTKFDIDIANVVKSKTLQSACKKVLADNINACDEVWAVSHGAGENLRAIGYEGDYIVMPNGVDLPRARASAEEIALTTRGYDLPANVPIYLFVGRMMWYKGIRIILDALARLKAQNHDFRMVFIGQGEHKIEMEDYAEEIGVKDKCIFTGAIRDRDILRAWYCRSDLFLFPSSYDTNGLVVREAAACNVASVLIRGSCAAEDVTDGRNGFLIDENGESLAACLASLYR